MPRIPDSRGLVRVEVWIVSVEYHPLGLDHPLVKRLDEASRFWNRAFIAKTRAIPGSRSERDAILDMQKAADDKASIEAEIRSLKEAKKGD